MRVALAAIRAAMTDDGRFAFETRNPLARAWETWDSEERPAADQPNGAKVKVSRRVSEGRCRPERATSCLDGAVSLK